MFGGWALPAPPKQSAEAVKREPLILTFPSCLVTSPQDPTFSKGVYNLFRQIRKLPDITPKHLECLNVSLEYDVPLEQFLPTTTILPVASDGAEQALTSVVSYLPTEDGEGAKNRTYWDRKKELNVPNNHAYESLARIRRDVKLGHFYRFFQSLELVSSYYGTEGQAHCGMPEKFREDMVKNFVEPLCWGYNARLL